jgi:hypothetical protein
MATFYGGANTDAIVAAIVDSAPSTLNTLNEIAAAINDDANFATNVTNSINALVSPAYIQGNASMGMGHTVDGTENGKIITAIAGTVTINASLGGAGKSFTVVNPSPPGGVGVTVTANSPYSISQRENKYTIPGKGIATILQTGNVDFILFGDLEA